jgi:hypothetical protein
LFLMTESIGWRITLCWRGAALICIFKKLKAI